MSIAAAEWVARAAVDDAVFARWPAYQVVLIAADRVDAAALAPVAAQLLAEAHREARASQPAESPKPAAPGQPAEPSQPGQPSQPGAVDEHTSRWHDAFRDFGVKPRVARPSSDALVRRAASDKGLPSINVLVDLYNAISIVHRVPIGGEDLDRYDGAARLVVATGGEPFHTTSDGQPVIEHPEPGEPVWVDDSGVTCRRWNWRQTNRTAIDQHTTRVGFIIDSLDAPDHSGAARAAEQLATLLPGAVTRTIAAHH